MKTNIITLLIIFICLASGYSSLIAGEMEPKKSLTSQKEMDLDAMSSATESIDPVVTKENVPSKTVTKTEMAPSDLKKHQAITYTLLANLTGKPLLVITQLNRKISGSIYELGANEVQFDTGNEILVFQSLDQAAFFIYEDNGSTLNETLIPTPMLLGCETSITIRGNSKASNYKGVVKKYSLKFITIQSKDGFDVNLPLDRVVAISFRGAHQSIAFSSITDEELDQIGGLNTDIGSSEHLAKAIRYNRSTYTAYGVVSGIAGFLYPLSGIFTLNPVETKKSLFSRPLLIGAGAMFSIGSMVPSIMIRKTFSNVPYLKEKYQDEIQPWAKWGSLLGFLSGAMLVAGPELLFWTYRSSSIKEDYNARVGGTAFCVLGGTGLITTFVFSGIAIKKTRSLLKSEKRKQENPDPKGTAVEVAPLLSFGEKSFYGMQVTYRY